jgi:farnesyl-diphosphate farnesyltransferase
MLPKVSRTFAICIRLLPSELEHPVLVAYLLCRVADTVEDTTDLGATNKGQLLAHFSRCLGDEGLEAAPLRAAFRHARSDEETLAREADAVLREFHRLSGVQRQAIRPFVQEMCAGMAEFTSRERVTPSGEVALDTVEDLERYCYYVAGTVGHLLTELFRLHTRSVGTQRYRRLKALATSFGLGLQLTNIIKDVADDRRRGWTFVPRQLCQLAGIKPEQLQDAQHRAQAGTVMRILIDKAKSHLCDALEYSVRLPRHQYRLRLFCLTSLYFAVRTIRLAEEDQHLLDPTHKVKISRTEVYRTLRATKVVAPSNGLVRAYFRHLAGDAWLCAGAASAAH